MLIRYIITISKHKLTLSIDKEIITKAQKQQINLSSFLEIRLTEYLQIKKCSRPNAGIKLSFMTNINIVLFFGNFS